ncbi:6-phospho-3-hexuloisomerase [Tepidibacillus marianensis]|uniref:6-phospho-3-hexuloisomerase n=1 Tax=Tepidibacillus marianensis TaxID=3131995 RepID=UPI0030CB0FC0
MRSIINKVSEEISSVLSKVKEEEAIALSQEVQKSKRIFVYGEGRSGLMGKAFAMRLMHGGYPVYVVGETITPSLQRGDLLIAITGSGSTSSILQSVSKAKEIGARVYSVTTNGDSKIALLSDGVLIVPAATKYRRPEEPETIQPLGNQFDQTIHLLLDGIIIYTLQQSQGKVAFDEMKQRHTNLE